MERPIYEIPVEGISEPRVGQRTAKAPVFSPASPPTVPPVVTTPPPDGFVPTPSTPSYSEAQPPLIPGTIPFPANETPGSFVNYPPPVYAQPLANTPPPVAAMPRPSASGSAQASARGGSVGDDPELVAVLQTVLQVGASDLHITANAAPTLRVDGALKAIPGLQPWSAERVSDALRSILTPLEIDRFDQTLELDFSYTLSESARFRVNFYQQRGYLGGAFRIIPTEIKQLAELGIPERIGQFASLSRGLVLVTGPTGSGKSTTLAALVDLVNRNRTDHIVTIEDPIEFIHANQRSVVNQREVGHDTHSFAAALKHVLRQDPDVILVGELRDLETISVALTAAETGHLVFATLHTQDAAQTIDRIIDVFPPHQQNQVRTQLAATLQGVVCQTLVKKSSGAGRAVATEVMITTPAVANLIREGKTYQIHSVLQAGREFGMHTLDQQLADLVNSGQITHEAAYEKAHDLADLKQLISRAPSGSKPGSGGEVSGIDFGDSFSTGVQ